MSHIITTFAFFHFKQWLKLAEEYSNRKIRPVQKYEQFHYNLPFIAFTVLNDLKPRKNYFYIESEQVENKISW